jgi:phosphorylase/glycogen(starch) synthase
MREKAVNIPDYLFEISWEVCNKVGGIHTVVASKALTLTEEFKDNYILIGPDVLKETDHNHEFIEDKFLYKSWREKAEREGLRIKVGRWDIHGKPILILVDFTPFFSEKDVVFAHLWERYKLDSLTGGWDYVEPALFGYAAGKVIESFYLFNISHHDRIVAQFHEWMTGTGVLYLNEHTPQVGTVFTTHATVLGRTISTNGLPLYKNLENYIPETVAKNLGVTAKYSLEKLAAETADIFTTVSDLTNNECRQFLGKEADIITPNGFEDAFVPVKDEYFEKRAIARKKLIEVSESLLGRPVPKDVIFILTSGRYEFRNIGIDLFIDAMGKLNTQPRLNEEVIAFIAVPAYQLGPRKDLLDRIAEGAQNISRTEDYLTHNLNDPEQDQTE